MGRPRCVGATILWGMPPPPSFARPGCVPVPAVPAEPPPLQAPHLEPLRSRESSAWGEPDLVRCGA